HSKSERIFRIITVDERDPEKVRRYGVAAAPLGHSLVDTYPQVEETVRLYRFVGQVIFKIDGENFQERNWYATDPNFFELFDFKLISGDRLSALQKPFSVILTQSTAKKYFG